MTPIQIIQVLLAVPAIRSLAIEDFGELVGLLFHKRAEDPVFKAESDKILLQLQGAQTDADQTQAHLALQQLMAS